jgi:uncharacterized protein
MNKLKIAAPILLVIIFTVLIVLTSHFVKTRKIIVIAQNEYLNFQFNYQLILLIITVIFLAINYLVSTNSFVSYFRVGNINAPTTELKIFGIGANDGWLKTGISLSVFISLATATFMYFQLKHMHINWALLQKGIFWILLFALTNSFAEEMIYRMGTVAPLKGLLQPTAIFLISSVLFGLPHLFGMPSGLLGATMAGVLGFVLAKSMYETNGIFWAWFIHFLQDVIIIGVLYLMSGVEELIL